MESNFDYLAIFRWIGEKPPTRKYLLALELRFVKMETFERWTSRNPSLWVKWCISWYFKLTSWRNSPCQSIGGWFFFAIKYDLLPPSPWITGWWQLKYFLCAPWTLGIHDPIWRSHILSKGLVKNRQLVNTIGLELPFSKWKLLRWTSRNPSLSGEWLGRCSCLFFKQYGVFHRMYFFFFGHSPPPHSNVFFPKEVTPFHSWGGD